MQERLKMLQAQKVLSIKIASKKNDDGQTVFYEKKLGDTQVSDGTTLANSADMFFVKRLKKRREGIMHEADDEEGLSSIEYAVKNSINNMEDWRNTSQLVLDNYTTEDGAEINQARFKDLNNYRQCSELLQKLQESQKEFTTHLSNMSELLSSASSDSKLLKEKINVTLSNMKNTSQKLNNIKKQIQPVIQGINSLKDIEGRFSASKNRTHQIKARNQSAIASFTEEDQKDVQLKEKTKALFWEQWVKPFKKQTEQKPTPKNVTSSHQGGPPPPPPPPPLSSSATIVKAIAAREQTPKAHGPTAPSAKQKRAEDPRDELMKAIKKRQLKADAKEVNQQDEPEDKPTRGPSG